MLRVLGPGFLLLHQERFIRPRATAATSRACLRATDHLRGLRWRTCCEKRGFLRAGKIRIASRVYELPIMAVSSAIVTPQHGAGAQGRRDPRRDRGQ